MIAPHEIKARHRYNPTLWKRRTGPKHDWQMTERQIHGGVIYFHACTACIPAHMEAYDMKLYGANI